MFKLIVSQLNLNLAQGSIKFNFPFKAAQVLKGEINDLMQSLKRVASKINNGEQKKAEKSLDYQHSGEVFVEIFCNPNIYPTPFAAKVLLTIKNEEIRFSTETELTRVVDDLKQYLDQFS